MLDNLERFQRELLARVSKAWGSGPLDVMPSTGPKAGKLKEFEAFVRYLEKKDGSAMDVAKSNLQRAQEARERQAYYEKSLAEQEALKKLKDQQANPSHWVQSIGGIAQGILQTSPSDPHFQYLKFLTEKQWPMQQSPLNPTPPSKEPLAPLPQVFMAGPIVAYRAWVLKDGMLCSLNNQQQWQPGAPFEAKCTNGNVVRNDEHSVPVHGCTCGVYAWKSPLVDARENQHTGNVVGAVALWGKLIEHAEGYRAQYAYPLALWVKASPMPGFPLGTGKTAEVAKTYRIATSEVPSLRDMEAAWSKTKSA